MNDITRDGAANRAYYNDRSVTAEKILSGSVKDPHIDLLRAVLPERVAASR